MKTIVLVIKSHTIVIPESVIETRLTSDGPVVQSIPVPERKIEYLAGREYQFKSKKDAKAFIDIVGTDIAKIVTQTDLEKAAEVGFTNWLAQELQSP